MAYGLLTRVAGRAPAPAAWGLAGRDGRPGVRPSTTDSTAGPTADVGQCPPPAGSEAPGARRRPVPGPARALRDWPTHRPDRRAAGSSESSDWSRPLTAAVTATTTHNPGRTRTPAKPPNTD